jgi:hypothetical protein
MINFIYATNYAAMKNYRTSVPPEAEGAMPQSTEAGSIKNQIIICLQMI